MAGQETNPFRRASMLQGTAFADYLSNQTDQHVEIIPPASLASRRLTSVSWNTEKESARAPSPVPEYTPSAPDSHRVVPREMVAGMSSLEDDPEQIMRIATELSRPPKYLANSHHTKNCRLPDYNEAMNDSAESIRHSVGLQRIGYNSAYRYPTYRDVRDGPESGEARRRRIEETNLLRRKLRRAGGIWSCLMCCIPKDRRAEGSMGTIKLSKRLLCAISLVMVLIITVPLVVVKVRKSPGNDNGTGEQKRPRVQFFELPGLPPIPLGETLVQPATVANMQTTCVTPQELWSCNLPPPATDATPDFRFEIRYRPVDRQRNGPDSIWAPMPAPIPSARDYEETSLKQSNTTAARIPTGFVLSMTFNNKLPESDKQNSTIGKRSELEYYEEETSERAHLEKHINIIKRDPSQNPPEMLPILLRNQPLWLMEKGLPEEHYTAHIYFRKSIYLDSINGTSRQPMHNNEVPGNSDKAKYICVWSSTRFKVQIFTRKNQDLILVDREGNRFEIDPNFGSSISNKRDAILPYPVTISEDRISGSGESSEKNLACYEILPDDSGQGGKKLGPKLSGVEEKPSIIQPSAPNGTKKEGCFCEWGNWKVRTQFDV